MPTSAVDFSINPDKFRWVPAATAPPPRPGDASGTLVVFDFDCTLSAEHMFNKLRTNEGQRELKRDHAAFFDQVFGGAERVAALQRFLRALRERSCKLRVLSFGVEDEINVARIAAGISRFIQIPLSILHS